MSGATFGVLTAPVPDLNYEQSNAGAWNWPDE